MLLQTRVPSLLTLWFSLEKAQVLRIVRALAIFRPSLIALQMPLSEEDEIFVERSIQRTILVRASEVWD